MEEVTAPASTMDS